MAHSITQSVDCQTDPLSTVQRRYFRELLHRASIAGFASLEDFEQEDYRGFEEIIRLAEMALPVHYNYDLQCWITDGFVADCGHTTARRHSTALAGRRCCNAQRFAGMTETAALAKIGEVN